VEGSNARGSEDPAVWFREHFDDAVDQVLAFLSGTELTIADKVVADIGCGDGIIDLGLALKGAPAKLVGYDLRPTDVDALSRAAAAAGVAEGLPDTLSFATSAPESIPAPDDSFDYVVTWSAFEHVTNPVQMLAEIARILKPDGVLFLQLWPFFHSEHGGHLWMQYDEPFPQLLRTDAQIREDIRGEQATDPSRDAVGEYDSLNRLTLDGLQRALLASGLITIKLELLTETVHIPFQLAHVPLSLLGIGGVKLLAVTHAKPGATPLDEQADE
jgi:SAM-dependent methyltransferase